MATAAELSGADLPKNTDSVSFAPTITGKADAQKQNESKHQSHHMSSLVPKGRLRTAPLLHFSERTVSQDCGESVDEFGIHNGMFALSAIHVGEVEFRDLTGAKIGA